MRTKAQLYLLGFVLIQASRVFASGLDALDSALSKANSVESFLNNAELKSSYKKAVDSYSGNEDFNCRGLGNNLRELEVLQSQVHGFSEKMFKPSVQPTSFDIDGLKITQVTRPFHAVWLTRASEGCGQRACNEKDKLLRDPFTASLDGTKFFVVEKGGKFTGSSIEVIPVKRGNERFDLVVDNDSTKSLSPAVLNKFLDKYKRVSKRTVLAVKVNKNRTETYYSFDGEPYFPLSEVKLEDPRAEQIFLAVGRRCGSGQGVAENEKSGDPLLSGAPTAPAVTAGGAPASTNSNANTFLANLTINNKTGEASKGMKDLLKSDPTKLKNQLAELAGGAPDSATREKAKDLLDYANKNSGGDPVYPIIPGGSAGGRSPASLSPTSPARGAANALGINSGKGTGPSYLNGFNPGGNPSVASSGSFPVGPGGGNFAGARGAGAGMGAGKGGGAGSPAGGAGGGTFGSGNGASPSGAGGGAFGGENPSGAKNSPQGAGDDKGVNGGSGNSARAESGGLDSQGNPINPKPGNQEKSSSVGEEIRKVIDTAEKEIEDKKSKKYEDIDPDKPTFTGERIKQFTEILSDKNHPLYNEAKKALTEMTIENPDIGDTTKFMKHLEDTNPKIAADLEKTRSECYCLYCGKRCCDTIEIEESRKKCTIKQ